MVAVTRTEMDRRDSDLAAELTDFALAGLTQAGVHGDSVALELALWRQLTDALERASCWERRTRLGGSPPDSVLAQIVHRAALTVAAAFTPRSDRAAVERRLRPWVAGLRVTARQRRQLAERAARTEQDWDRAVGDSGTVRALRVAALN